MLAAHAKGPVYVVCDNARYDKNKALAEWLADQRLVQVFLPPYSPNLNRMERLWKFLRQKISNTAFYRTKGQFKTAVLDFFDRLPKFGQQLASRLEAVYLLLRGCGRTGGWPSFSAERVTAGFPVGRVSRLAKQG